MISLGLGPSNWRELKMRGIYDMAKKRNRIIRAKLGLHEFEYALINPKDGYGRDRVSTTGEPYKYSGTTVTREIIDAEKSNSLGENIKGCAFVFERVVPASFRDYVGLHECVEAAGNEHIAACRTDLEEVMKNPTLFEEYAQYLLGLAQMTIRKKDRGEDVNGYFDRALPDFLDVIKKGTLSAVELVTEFKKQIDLLVPPLSPLTLKPPEQHL